MIMLLYLTMQLMSKETAINILDQTNCNDKTHDISNENEILVISIDESMQGDLITSFKCKFKVTSTARLDGESKLCASWIGPFSSAKDINVHVLGGLGVDAVGTFACETNEDNKLEESSCHIDDKNSILRENCYTGTGGTDVEIKMGGPPKLVGRKVKLVIYDSGWDGRTVYMDGLFHNDDIYLYNR